MTDPLSEIVLLLQPRASFSKVVGGAGSWLVRRSEPGLPFYCAVLEGSFRLAVEGQKSMILTAGDFILIPAAFEFAASSLEPELTGDAEATPVQIAPGEFRVGAQHGPPDVRFLMGHIVFGSTDATLLVPLLPLLVHVRGDRRLTTLVQLVNEEAREQRPARDIVLVRLLEVLLVEALRSEQGGATSPGLVRGLGDERLAIALRLMHERPSHPWSVMELAKQTALSRSAFFDRFKRAVGVAPMEYLLGWRLALAKNLLRQRGCTITEVAERVGYSSASTFSVAFSRHVGSPPARYAGRTGGAHKS